MSNARKVNNSVDLEVNSIGDNIVHISMTSKNQLARAMCRFQEYYESPFEDIRGQIFTLGYLKSKGSRSNPRINTYCGTNLTESDWDGYNFPRAALEPFFQGLFDPLTPEEECIVEMLKYRTDNFYVIATYGDQDLDADDNTIEHEVRHALYGTCEAYRKEVNTILARHSVKLRNLKKLLSSWGYHETVLDDECHAYMGADHDYFFNGFKEDVTKFKVKRMDTLRDQLNEVADKYKKKLKLSY